MPPFVYLLHTIRIAYTLSTSVRKQVQANKFIVFFDGYVNKKFYYKGKRGVGK